MKRRYVLASMGAFTASGSLAVGSSAFSSTEAARQTNVDVVGDEDAYLGLDYNDDEDGVDVDGAQKSVEVQCGDQVKLFDVINQFPNSIETLTISADNDAFRICETDCNTEDDDLICSSDFESCQSIENGQSLGIWLEPTDDVCGESVETILQIKATGAGFHVDAERAFEVEVIDSGFDVLEVEIRLNNDDMFEQARFSYELFSEDTVTFTIDDPYESKTRSGSSKGNNIKLPDKKINQNDENSANFPVTLTAEVDGGDCYFIEINDAVTDKEEYSFEEGHFTAC